MKKILSILFFLCLAITSWAYEWTDDNGVKWYFEQ